MHTGEESMYFRGLILGSLHGSEVVFACNISLLMLIYHTAVIIHLCMLISSDYVVLMKKSDFLLIALHQLG